MSESIKELLHAHKLNKTPCRAEMLRVLVEADKALSEQEIKDQLGYDYDRVTVFRTLRTFVDTGLVHHVTVNMHEVKFALSKPESQKNGNIGHAHFHCDACGEVVCLGNFTADETVIPEHFTVKGYELIINGICAKCNA